MLSTAGGTVEEVGGRVEPHVVVDAKESAPERESMQDGVGIG